MKRLISVLLLLCCGLARANLPHDKPVCLDCTALVNRWGHVLDGYSYVHDALGLRTNILRDLGGTSSASSLKYDSIGQITSWTATEPDGSPRLNEQFGFGFDKAGNLLSRTNGNLIQTFANDSLNQLTNVSRTGTFTVSGATPGPAASVTVNGQTAQTYGDFTFAATNQTLTNGSNTFTIIAQKPGGGSVTNNLGVNLPASVSLQFDRNGNLTNDGTRSFAYSAENQLTNIFVVGNWRSVFVYDGLGRRRIARDYTWSSSIGNWQLTNEVHYVYDGMLPVQELDITNNVLVTYTRGLDLSGSLAGAGGIGGLLARTDGNGSTFYHADGAGNITAIIDGNQSIAARYMYSALGDLINRSGPLADANVIRFSSRSAHPLSGTYDFLFRQYLPNPGRFSSQDPIGEAGGMNLYGFVGNNPISFVDPYGLDSFVPGVNGSRENSLPALTLTGTPGGALSASYPGPDSFVIGGLAIAGAGGVAAVVEDPVQSLFVAAAVLDARYPQQANLTLGVMPSWMGGPRVGKCPTKLPKLGYRGSKPWRDALGKIVRGSVKEGDTVDLGFTPTQEQAMQLLQDAGVDMGKVRPDPAHAPPNPHDFPHINYPTPSGGKGTIRTQ